MISVSELVVPSTSLAGVHFRACAILPLDLPGRTKRERTTINKLSLVLF